MAEQKGNLVGKIVFDIFEHNGDWYSRVQPVMLTQDPREYLKLGLLTAAVQQYLRDSTGFINNIVKNVKDIDEATLEIRKGLIKKVQSLPKGPPKAADVDTKQLPLDLGKLSNDEPRQAEADDWADNGFDDGEEDDG